MSTNTKTGAELNQIARLLFDAAANSWCFSGIAQILAGVTGIVVSLLTLNDSEKLISAIAGFGVLLIAYCLKMKSDDQYSTAETMRRQAAFSEGLNWPISSTLKSEWLRRVGNKIIKKAETNPRAEDYYNSEEETGPRKLLEMTIESAFYTRHLYSYLTGLLWVLFLGSIFLCFLVLSFLTSKIVPNEYVTLIAYALYLVLPILLSLDLIGSIIKLNGLTSAILEVEKDMERLAGEDNPNSDQVIRLVSEYNCQVACGIPIHPFLFKIWQDGISKLWNIRKNATESE